jgi:hypothetical protein
VPRASTVTLSNGSGPNTTTEGCSRTPVIEPRTVEDVGHARIRANPRSFGVITRPNCPTERIARGARPYTVRVMNAQNQRGAALEQQRLFGDLRRRNERRADLARLLEAQRRQQIERVMRVARQRTFRRDG